MSRDPYPPSSLTPLFVELDTVPVSAWRDLWNYKEELRVAMWKYGKHLTACSLQKNLGPCDCGWVQVRETLASEPREGRHETG